MERNVFQDRTHSFPSFCEKIQEIAWRWRTTNKSYKQKKKKKRKETKIFSSRWTDPIYIELTIPAGCNSSWSAIKLHPLASKRQRRSWLLEADAKQNNCSHYFVKQDFATVTLLLLLLPSPTPRYFLAFVLVFTPFTYWRIYARRYKIFTAPLAALLASSRASLLLPPASTLGTSLTTRNCAGVAFVCRGRRPFATDPTPV